MYDVLDLNYKSVCEVIDLNVPIFGEYKFTQSSVNKIVTAFSVIDITKPCRIIVDFTECKFFDAYLCAVLGAYLDKYHRSGFRVAYREPRKASIHTILKKNGFLVNFGLPRDSDTNETTVKYFEFETSDESLESFTEYVLEDLLTKNMFDLLSDIQKGDITYFLSEIFSNALLHSNSQKIHCCGQYFPQRNGKSLIFAIVDTGVGFKQNLYSKNKSELMDDYASIEWALEKGNTTRKIANAPPGGLGLYELAKFVNSNKSSLMIISGIDMLRISDSNVIFRDNLDTSHNGVIVLLNIKLDDLD